MDNPELIHYYTKSSADNDLTSFDFGDDLIGRLDKFETDANYRSIPDEDTYDAINDETFGAELANLPTETDLADFAKMTETLVIDDEPSGSSIEPPDPSQLPIPRIQNYHYLEFNQKEERIKAGQRAKNAANLRLTPTDETSSYSSIWASGSFNGIGSLNSELYMGQQPKVQQSDLHEQLTHPPLFESVSPSKSYTIATYAVNAEELERKFIEEAAAINNHHNKLPFISHSQLLESSELERRMLSEAVTAANMLAKQYNQQQATAIQIASKIQEQLKQQQLIAKQTMIAATMAAATIPQQQGPGVISNNIDTNIVPALSDVSAQMQWPQPSTQSVSTTIASNGTARFQPLSAMQGISPCFLAPPPGMSPIPPIHYMMHLLHQNRETKFPNSGIAVIPPYARDITSNQINSKFEAGKKTVALSQLHMVPASLHPRVEKQRRQKANYSALPSGKTITDYALDPYAGLMSTKEREWLIKIHIIQCLGTGDPMEDDYYYTLWKQQNVLSKAPEGSTKREKPKYYSFETTFPAIGYTAPSFMGSLGKPIHCTSSQPRQMIEVNSECPDDDSINGKQTAANRQKRLRAMLMKIENAALMLVDCRDIRRKLHFFEDTRITEFIEQHEITDRVARFVENLTQLEISIFSPDQLPTVMLIQKGRQLVYGWLHFLRLNEQQREIGVSTTCYATHGYNISKVLAYMCMCMSILGKFARKLPDDSLPEFSQGFCTLFSKFLSHAELFELLQASRKLESSIISDSKIVQLTLLSLLESLIISKNGELLIQELEGTGVGHLLFTMHGHYLKLQPNKDKHLLNTAQWKHIRTWLVEHWRLIDCYEHVENVAAEKILIFGENF